MKDIKELLNFGLINIDKPAGPARNFVSRGGGSLCWWVVGRFAGGCLLERGMR